MVDSFDVDPGQRPHTPPEIPEERPSCELPPAWLRSLSCGHGPTRSAPAQTRTVDVTGRLTTTTRVARVARRRRWSMRGEPPGRGATRRYAGLAASGSCSRTRGSQVLDLGEKTPG